MSTSTKIERVIHLTNQEATLCQLLVDTSTSIGGKKGCPNPEIRITGGWVRDKLLGFQSHDIDIGIDSMTGVDFANSIKDFLQSPESKEKYDGEHFGRLATIAKNPEKSKHLETATIRLMGFDVDFVNLRKETYSTDSRNPIMENGTPREDAFRRDATVNALFYNIKTLEVEDFTGKGLEDLQSGVLRTPLDPYQTFKDDPLRVLRIIRFASRLSFEVHPSMVQAMGDSGIKQALRNKISRERIGTELSKMLQGPNPRAAILLIDRFGLYTTLFIDPKAQCPTVATENWHLAYEQLTQVMNAKADIIDPLEPLHVVNRILLQEPEETYLAWILCCLVPLARATPEPLKNPKSKSLPTLAAMAAREGIKADNKITNTVEIAALSIQDIITTKDSFSNEAAISSLTLKRKHPVTNREAQGKAIRRWGFHWRSSVMYALLVQVMEAKVDLERQAVINSYATWLTKLENLNLLNVHLLKPIIDGNQLAEALGRKSGPWTKKAKEMAIEWMLRNPDETSQQACIEDVVARKKELGLDDA